MSMARPGVFSFAVVKDCCSPFTARVSVATVREPVRSRTTASGMLFAEVTIRCDGALPVSSAHELADATEAAIHASVGAADVTVHIEPA